MSSSSGHQGGPTAPSQPRSGTCNILFVDDDDSYLQLMQMAVSRLRPRWRMEGQLATPEWLAEWSDHIGDIITDFDVIVLDYQLCDIDALQMIGPLRDHFEHCPPITVLSGTLTPEREQACLQRGARWCATKPYSLADTGRLLDLFEDVAAGLPRDETTPLRNPRLDGDGPRSRSRGRDDR